MNQPLNTSEVTTNGEDIGQLVEATATHLFQDFGALHQRTGAASPLPPQVDERVWGSLVDAGLPFALLTEEHGGVGIDNGFLVARLSGAHALDVPLVESLAANWLLNRAGLPTTSQPCTVAEQTAQISAAEPRRLTGTAFAVPWARACELVIVATQGNDRYLVHVRPNQYSAKRDINMAGEPRDSCVFDTTVGSEQLVALPGTWKPDSIRLLGAALRTAQMAGAIESALAMTVTYAGARRQFGRSIGSFQAVQQLLASMATQTAAARVAADLAAIAVGSDLDAVAIAVAKARVGEAAGAVSAGAHQVHGALGFTREYALHLLTRRLWAWRDDYGGEAEWSIRLGRQIAQAGADQLWASLTEI